MNKIFDVGDIDVQVFANLSRSFRPGQKQKRINVDFPDWMIQGLDKESNRLGVPRQSLIKVWIAERLEGLRLGDTV
ncbi:MAG: CopG family transcriptional regulator [Spirochaetes bacterium]|nr:MAG: CopG family transcriptional regulator [Spirochaetota bacterium]